MLEKISKLMKKDGELIIAAPNCEANENSVYKENWAAYDVPRHLFH